MDKIPVCVAYDVNGERVEDFPRGERLRVAKPIFEYFDGWKCDINHCRKEEDLPVQAREYIAAVEKMVGCPITYVSVGAERDEYIVRNK